jgi:UDP-N-acetylglucosamine:LPS N-acetylglucosamine transferase
VKRKSREAKAGSPKVMLVASSGGHIYEMFCLRDFWGDKERVWVSFPTADARYLLAAEKAVHWAAYPTTRNVPNLVRNLGLAWRLLRRERPALIVSTGAGVAAPFFWIGWLLGIPAVFVESITRITDLSLTARLVRPFASKVLVQWPELAAARPGLEHHGRVA